MPSRPVDWCIVDAAWSGIGCNLAFFFYFKLKWNKLVKQVKCKWPRLISSPVKSKRYGKRQWRRNENQVPNMAATKVIETDRWEGNIYTPTICMHCVHQPSYRSWNVENLIDIWFIIGIYLIIASNDCECIW